MFATAPADNDRLDKSGIPWDERIHASSRAKTADGQWRKRRGIDDAVVARVEAELKALMAIPVAPSAQALDATGEVLRAAPAPTPIAIVPPPPPPQPAATADRNAFVALITMASNAIGAKKLTQEQLTAAVVAAGVPSLPLLGNRLDLVPQVTAALETIIACAA